MKAIKRLISLLLSFTLILSFISIDVFAAAELSVSATTAYDSGNNLYYNVSAWYKFDKEECGNSVVIEMVKKSKGFSSSLSDADIYYIDEAIIGEDGTVRFDFKVKNYDEYTIRFTSGDFNISSSVTKDIILLKETGTGSLEEILEDILNTSDLNEMVEKINNEAYKLNLNTTYLNELSNPTSVASVLKANKDNLNASNYSELFDRTVIFNYLNQQTDLTKTIDMLEYYEGTYLKIGSQQYAGIYPAYKNMDTETKKKVISSLKNGSYNSFDSFREAFNQAVILTALKNYDMTSLDKVFTDNLDYLGFSGYTSLSLTDKGDILGKLITDTSINSVSTLKTQYDYYKSGTVLVPILPPQGNTQTGGVTGGVSSTTTVDKELANPENNQQSVDLRTDFTDLSSHEWAREAIEDLAYKKILSGKGNRQFFPGDNIKREEFIKILVLAFGLYDETATCTYTDIPTDNWAYSYVASGTKAGLTVGYEDGSFGAGANITREDMAVMVHRLLVSIRNIDRITDLSKTFDDMDLVSGYAVNSVKMLLNAGLVQGDNNKFNPKNNTTRAEAAQLIYNILKGEI